LLVNHISWELHCVYCINKRRIWNIVCRMIIFINQVGFWVVKLQLCELHSCCISFKCIRVISALLTLVFTESTLIEVFPSYSQSVKLPAFFANVCVYTLHTYWSEHISFTSYYTYMVDTWILLETALHKTCFCAPLHNAIPLQRIVFEKLISQLDWRKSFILLTRNIQT
jgi:hypothetical protein